MSIIVDTYTNPAWKIGAVVRHVGPGQFIVICGATQERPYSRYDSKLGRDVTPIILDAFNPLSSVRVFSDRDNALRHAQMVVFGELRPVEGDVNVA